MRLVERLARPKRDRTRCVHCGAPTKGKDHVPPKAIFGDLLKAPPAVNLITVPACEACNLGRTQDDTYFRDVMYMLAQRDGETPHTDAVGTAIARGTKHAGTAHTTPIQSLFRHSVPTWLASSVPGIYEQFSRIEVNWTRIKSVVAGTARGLYWHHRNERIPDGYDVRVSGDREREGATAFWQAEGWAYLAREAVNGYRTHIHENAFSYAMSSAADDPRAVAFLFLVYRRVLFLVLVVPKLPAIFLR